jgi:hypothetical protein
VGGVSAAFQLLTHRLEWPVARVRCEAAYQLADAILEGAPGASDALLAWTAGRQLESEAVIGVSILDAFNLGPQLDGDAVIAAVRMPSYLSDLLIRRNYPTAKNLFPFRYGYARGGGTTDPDLRAYFDRNIGQVIARRYQSRLLDLEQRGGRPFVYRWFEEWAWLQQTLDAPFSGRPDYVWGGGPRENSANVQVRQTELYVSAYLRTLAYAVAEWRMPASFAEDAALEALPLSRGLAGVRPVTRPSWAFTTLKTRAKRGLHAAAADAWRKAEHAADPGQKLLALRTTDHSETEFLAFSFRRVLLPPALALPPKPGAEFDRVPWAMVEDHTAGMAGPLEPLDSHKPEASNFLSAYVQPARFPRFLTDFFPHGVELAHPRLFNDSVAIEADSRGLILVAGGRPESRWVHWYADWKPTHPPTISRLGGGLTTIQSRVLTLAVRKSGMVPMIYCQAIYGQRQHAYEEAKVERETFWL